MKKILVVEDDFDSRKGLGIRLRAHNYEPVFAIDSVAAVKTALTTRPDLVLLDLGLPGGDGFAVLQRFKDLTPLADLPVIVLTGMSCHAKRERAAELGVDGYLQKPADNEVLMDRIRATLEKQDPAPDAD